MEKICKDKGTIEKLTIFYSQTCFLTGVLCMKQTIKL